MSEYKQSHDPVVLVKQEKVRVALEFKYLGIILDSQLSLKKKHSQTKVLDAVKCNLTKVKLRI